MRWERNCGPLFRMGEGGLPGSVGGGGVLPPPKSPQDHCLQPPLDHFLGDEGLHSERRLSDHHFMILRFLCPQKSPPLNNDA